MADAEIGSAELIVYAVPTQALREVAAWVAPRRAADSLQLSLAKGYELGSLERPTQVIGEVTGSPAAALSGPNHAEEIGRDMPSATVIASADRGGRRAPAGGGHRRYVARLHQRRCRRGRVLRRDQEPDRGRGRHLRRPRLRRQLARGAHDARSRRGRAARAGARGALRDVQRPRRHRRPHRHLHLAPQPQPARRRAARSRRDAGEAAAQVGQVVEGFPTAYALHDLAARYAVEIPVTENVYEVLEGRRTPSACVADLMGRLPKRE